MCQHLSVVFDCFCSNRVVEIYTRQNGCGCLFKVKFHSIKAFVCPLCTDIKLTRKISNAIEHFLIDDGVVLDYNEDPLCCVEKVFC